MSVPSDAFAALESTYPAGTTRPTLVLVHGAWADAASWSGVVAAYQAAGFPVRAFPNQVLDLTTDAEDLAEYLTVIDGPVVLVGHSYGGSVITDVVAEDPRIQALVYIDAIAPDVGESNISLIGDDSFLTADPATLYDSVGYGAARDGAKENYLKREVFVEQFASSVEPTQAAQLWAQQRGAADPAFNTPARNASWKTIPSWFFISTGDTIITPAAMRSVAERAKSTVVTYEGGSYLTLVSDPDAVVDVIARALVGVRQA